ncbi:MAG TPA: hypothetical protein PLB88_11085 [Thermoanaerobaculaceae bacterium]|nr:hypothetical protein [Thermoanaerobaculaceae bacterium]
MSTSRFRKIFIDSRWRTTGTHADFSISLPVDVETSATATVYLASCSFSNTFQTIRSGENDRVYVLGGPTGGTIGTGVLTLSPGIYTGAQLASALQTALIAAELDQSATVTFDEIYGTLTFAQSGHVLQIPSEAELRNPYWKATQWDARNPPAAYQYDISNPASMNELLYPPTPSSLQESFTTGNIDLVPYRSVYLHSSLTNFMTLKAGTGERDCLARLPVDQPYNYVVVWKHLGASDAIEASGERLRTLSFSFRDWAGRLVPIDQPVQIELVIMDADPYNL